MKNAPTIQYEITSDNGGTCVMTSANQPSNNRIGLLIDSLSTSRYGHSLVRIGGTLYSMPMTQSQTADPRK